MLRRRDPQPEPQPGPDPLRAWSASLDPSWRPPVERAIASRDQFEGIISQLPPGPTRDRLEELRVVLHHSVSKVADAVWRASTATALASSLDLERATAELKAARRELSVVEDAGGDVAPAQAKVAALAEHHRAINDALNLADDAGGRLDELNLQLDTAVARAATIVVRSQQSGGPERIDAELDDVVRDLQSLDQALEELGP